jgi:hypothetical protein
MSTDRDCQKNAGKRSTEKPGVKTGAREGSAPLVAGGATAQPPLGGLDLELACFQQFSYQTLCSSLVLQYTVHGFMGAHPNPFLCLVPFERKLSCRFSGTWNDALACDCGGLAPVIKEGAFVLRDTLPAVPLTFHYPALLARARARDHSRFLLPDLANAVSNSSSSIGSLQPHRGKMTSHADATQTVKPTHHYGKFAEMSRSLPV